MLRVEEHRKGPSYHPDVDAILVKLNPSIVSHVKRVSASARLREEECEDLAQRVRMKLSVALSGRTIANLPAYLKKTISHEFITLLRQRKVFYALPLSDDGEALLGNVLLSVSCGMRDPSQEFEQQVVLQELLHILVDAVLLLPSVQRLALLCLLCERVDDLALLVAAFRERDIDISCMHWPVDKHERQRLRASCRPAIINLAHTMKIDLRQYKPWSSAR